MGRLEQNGYSLKAKVKTFREIQTIGKSAKSDKFLKTKIKKLRSQIMQHLCDLGGAFR